MSQLAVQDASRILMEVVIVTEAAIADHGLIGDLHTAALISTDGSVDWFCCPRFDSPSVFGALLDDARGGHFRVRPAGGAYASKQMYFPDSAALITRFFTADGVGEVVDFMPVLGRTVTANHRLVRMVRCVRGRMRFEVDIAPRFDYGRRAHRTELTDSGVVFSTDALTLTLHAVREPDDARLAQAQVDEGDVRATIDLVAGQVRGVMLESAADGPPREVRPAEVWRLFDDTVAFWQSWLGQSTYRGRWREVVNRSAITLKLMTYAPTGGLVAAPTAALPEQVGGERNWDYRYTWVRDASFSVGALLSIGFVEEAEQFGVWSATGSASTSAAAAARSTSCTGSTGRAISRRRCSSTGRATAARARCGSATAPPTNCSWTSTARRWTASSPATGVGCRWRTGVGRGSATSWIGSRRTGISPRRASGRPAAGARRSPTGG